MTVSRILIATDAVGGVWTYSTELAGALRAVGLEAVLASMGPPPDERQLAMAGSTRVIDTGQELDWLAETPQDVRRAGLTLARLAAEVEADVVQLHSAALACEVAFDQPVVAVQHSCVATWWDAVREGPLAPDFIWRRDMVECGLNAADAVVAPTAAFAAQTARTYALPWPPYAVHNGRTAIALPSRRQAGFVLTIGRLWDEGKNVRTLDAAARTIDVAVEAIGPLAGPNGTTVRYDHLVTPGALDERAIAQRLAARPIFASSALYEPFGLSVLEAAQAACPLVLSDIPTFRELWGDAAVFVPPTDAQRFADAISTLLSNPELREAYGRAAQLRALCFTADALASRMVQIYRQLMSAKDTRASVEIASVA